MYISLNEEKTVETCKVKLKPTRMHVAQDRNGFFKSWKEQETIVQWKTENKVNGCDESTDLQHHTETP